MEPSEITKVLARASELQAKIDIAIRRASLQAEDPTIVQSTQNDDEDDNGNVHGHGSSYNDNDDDDVVDGYGNQGVPRGLPDLQKLKAIRLSLIDLQHQLDCLQVLQKQQKFERENVLVKLEERRKILIRRLREYNGTEWEIIQDAHAFVGVPVQRKDDLVLPPYQDPVEDVLTSEEQGTYAGFGKRSHVSTRQSSSRRVSLASRPDDDDEAKLLEEQNNVNENPRAKTSSGFKVFATRVRQAVSFSAKTALVLTSLITILALSQMEQNLRKSSAERASRMQSIKGRPQRLVNQSSPPSDTVIAKDKICPPGKVLFEEDGVLKCFVKERVEAPFEEVIEKPDASYGYG